MHIYGGMRQVLMVVEDVTEQAKLGAALAVQYMGEQYPVTVAAVGSTPLFDPDNSRMKA